MLVPTFCNEVRGKSPRELADRGDTLSRTKCRNWRRNFDVIVPRVLLAQRIRLQRTFSIVVGSIAVMALVIGGIGIMNIMLTSVIERTCEIGIRRTLGATKRDVRRQFLTEALLMTLSGGAAGIVLGVALSAGITAFGGDVRLGARTTRASRVRTVVLLRHEQAIPAQDRVWCDDAGDARQPPPAEHPAFHRQPAPLVVGEAEPPRSVRGAQDPVLFEQVVNDSRCCRLTQPAKSSTTNASGGGSESIYAERAPKGCGSARHAGFEKARNQIG